MQQTVNERINFLISSLGLTKNSFAKSINKAATVIGHIVDGRNKPGFEVLDNILATYPQVNAAWLMTGEGEMFKDNAASGSFSGNTQKSSNSVQGYGNTTTTHAPDTDCQHQLALALKELEGARNEITLLKQMIDILSKK